jgi:hypothetical protein
MRHAIARDAMAFAEADRGIVNDRIEWAERVDLARDILDGRDVARSPTRTASALGAAFFTSLARAPLRACKMA